MINTDKALDEIDKRNAQTDKLYDEYLESCECCGNSPCICDRDNENPVDISAKVYSEHPEWFDVDPDWR